MLPNTSASKRRRLDRSVCKTAWLSNLAPNITELLRAVLQRQNSFARMSHGLRLAVLTMQRGQMIILVQEEKKRRGKLASNIQYEV